MISATRLENFFVIFLAKNVAAFRSCPKRLPKLKNIIFNSLAEAMSSQPSIGSVAQLLVIILMQAYDEKQPSGTKRKTKFTV